MSPRRRAAVTSRKPPFARDPAPAAARGPLDLTLARRSVALELIAGRGHYERVIQAVLRAHTSVWIATANVKELMVEDGRSRYVSDGFESPVVLKDGDVASPDFRNRPPAQ